MTSAPPLKVTRVDRECARQFPDPITARAMTKKTLAAENLRGASCLYLAARVHI